MAFNIKPFFNLNKMSTSVFERDMGDDPVFARTPKNGVIILNEDAVKNSSKKELDNTIAHEQEQVLSTSLTLSLTGLILIVVAITGKSGSITNFLI